MFIQTIIPQEISFLLTKDTYVLYNIRIEPFKIKKWGVTMEFSNMIKRCKLSEISNFISGWGEILEEKEESDFETAIRNMDRQTEELIEEYFQNENDRDRFFAEISNRETVIRETYFQLGFIAGINFMKELEKREKELR